MRYQLSGQSVVTLDGKDYYLGKHDSPESLARYAVLIAAYQKHGLIALESALLQAHAVDVMVAIVPNFYTRNTKHQQAPAGATAISPWREPWDREWDRDRETHSTNSHTSIWFDVHREDAELWFQKVLRALQEASTITLCDAAIESASYMKREAEIRPTASTKRLAVLLRRMDEKRLKRSFCCRSCEALGRDSIPR